MAEELEFKKGDVWIGNDSGLPLTITGVTAKSITFNITRNVRSRTGNPGTEVRERTIPRVLFADIAQYYTRQK